MQALDFLEIVGYFAYMFLVAFALGSFGRALWHLGTFLKFKSRSW